MNGIKKKFADLGKSDDVEVELSQDKILLIKEEIKNNHDLYKEVKYYCLKSINNPDEVISISYFKDEICSILTDKMEYGEVFLWDIINMMIEDEKRNLNEGR